MAKVKKMAFGGMGSMAQNRAGAKPAQAAPKSALAPGAKPLPPGSIGMPGGPGGATTYNTGPMPKGGPDYISSAKPMGGGAGFGNSADPAKFAALNAAMTGKPAGVSVGLGSMPKNVPAGAEARMTSMMGGQTGPIATAKPAPTQAPTLSAATARSGINSTNSGAPKSGTAPKANFGAAVKQLGLGARMKSGGSVSSASSASKRADGIATKGKTKGRVC